MKYIFSLYNNYFIVPIYFLIGLFFQINYLAQKEINEMHKAITDDNIYNGVDDSIDVNDNIDNQNKFDFSMVTESNTIDDIIGNKNIFIKKYYSTEYDQTYLNVLVLRENIPWAIEYYRPMYLLFLENFLETNSKLYLIYKTNLDTSSLTIYAPINNSQSIIKNIIQKNFISIINILGYDSKYNYCYFLNPEKLYIEWIKPIEPTDKLNYKKITEMSIETKNVLVNGIQYTDITCFRNFIQKDFKFNLEELFWNEETEFKNIQFLYTIYRIDSESNITTILW